MIRIAGRYYRQLSSNMKMGRGAYVAIAVELREEGLGHVKPSECRPTEEMLHRLGQRAAALHDWLAIIGNPANGPLAQGKATALDAAAEWASTCFATQSIENKYR